jgi:hypothetical protein
MHARFEMKSKNLFFKLVLVFVAALALAPPLHADEPIIPPTVDKVWPAGMERGKTAVFTLDGRNITATDEVIFDSPGITGKVTQVTDVPEKITGPRAGVDLGAQVALGKKQTAQMQVTVAKDVAPGLHYFRVHSPLGTSNTVVFAVGSLPEVNVSASEGSEGRPQVVKLPATLVGTLSAPGEMHTIQFEGTAGEELVCQVVASQLGSALESLLILSDASGGVIVKAGENNDKPDALLTVKLPADGIYNLSIADREKGGGSGYFYRLDAGPLPYITGVFPLGVRAGEPAQVSVTGLNLGGVQTVKVEPPKTADGWTTIPLKVKNGDSWALNSVKLAVGGEPEITEQKPSLTIAQAQMITPPVTINGRINESGAEGGAAGEDYFRFHARQGEVLNIAVAAARLGSALDSVIEVLDAQGNPIPRATIRCLNQTTTTLSDRDSESSSIRLVSTAGLHVSDYLMVGDELDQIESIPDQPDADVDLKSISGLRRAFLGTSPDVHAVDTPVYRAEILPPGAQFPPNGLPVFQLTWRNDDGGPGFGADSRLNFVAPKDGDYILHLKDVRGLGGPEFAYRLTLRDFKPDFKLAASPGNPNIPKGDSIPLRVSANRLEGYEGPVEIAVTGLPQGITASPAIIPQGQDSTVVILSAAADLPPTTSYATIKVVGRATVNGHELVRTANEGAPLQLASVIPPPDVVVTTDLRQISIEPGKEIKVTLHVQRQNGFKGRVPCSVENLPPGVRVVNVGLNGVLVTETQTSRTFTIRAEDWAKPIQQPIYVVAEVESNMPTRHSSAPLILNVADNNTSASASSGSLEPKQSPAAAHPPRH